jgi:DNA polymerase III epsilon subunit family exonuclease
VGPFAVIDLETTGLSDDARSEILEVGAVLVDPGVATVATIETLLRPAREVPPAITRLTGITRELVAGAPELERVRSDLAKRLAGRALVAHNADFEKFFLERDVMREAAGARFLDTQDLVAITHPDAPDLRLETFTRRMLGSEERHRALADALDAARVLSRVAAGAREGEPRYAAARESLLHFAPDSPWLALFPEDAPWKTAPAESPWLEIGESTEPPVPFDEEAIAAALADEARGRRHFPGYRVREEQIRLARHFVRNLEAGSVLLLEGGTGVGKSLAYLAAAIPFVMTPRAGGRRDPVVISTRTKLLQDQLLQKDIAAAARFLGWPGLRALSMKGRANYACARRLDRVLEEGREARIFAEERMAYAVLEACARIRPQGELRAIPGALLYRFKWLRDLIQRAVSTRSEQCTREQCATRPDCPFGRRRTALSEAQIVVANHDLLLRWPPDYPAFRHAIADEAHELAGVADEVYAQDVRPDEVLGRIDEVFGRPSEAKSASLLPGRERRAVRKDAIAWRRGVQQDLVSLGRAIAEKADEFGVVHVPESPGRELVEAQSAAETAAARLDALAAAIEKMDPSEAEEGEGGPLARAAADLRGWASTLRVALDGGGGDAVASFDGLVPPWDQWRCVVRPVSPAAPFEEQFLSKLESFAGVSASLFIEGDAFAALGELEIESRARDRLERVSAPSPFPYGEHMRVVALESRGDAVGETTEVIEELALRLGGRVLGLFTSRARMNEVAERLAPRLVSAGIEVLTPRRASDDLSALLERFRQGDAVLLGARAFWQGIDVPGSDLQAVVIEKLPFDVPTELLKRRERRLAQEGMRTFERFTLGRMLLNLKQMIGRLIRSESDRGLVVIVEGRTTKNYFRRLPNALPPGSRIEVAKLADLGRMLSEVGIETRDP